MSLAVATATTTPRYTAPAWPGRRPPAGPRAHAPGRRLSAPRSHDLAAIREWAQTGTPDTPRADNPNHGNTGRNQVQELQRLDRPFHMNIQLPVAPDGLPGVMGLGLEPPGPRLVTEGK